MPENQIDYKNPVAIRNEILQKEKELKPELERVLSLFEKAGYSTHKGTNSYILANLLVDYTDRLMEERASWMSYLNYWETNDISIISRLAYSQYRIYNLRHLPELYEADKDYSIAQKEGFLTGYKEPNILANAEANIIHLGRIDKITKPINLRRPYDDLYAGSYFYVKERKPQNELAFESFMTEDGEYIEMQYTILPDMDGIAQFVPSPELLESLKKHQNESAYLVIFTKHNQTPRISNFKKIRSEVLIDADYLRFVTTELFAKFKILNRMSSKSFQKFLYLRYKDFPTLIADNIIYVPYVDDKILDFARRNVIPPLGKTWYLQEVDILEIPIDKEVKDYLNLNVPKIITQKEIKDSIKFHLMKFYEDLGHKSIHKIEDILKDLEIEDKDDYVMVKFNES